MAETEKGVRGRGAGSNPDNRFEKLGFEADPEGELHADETDADRVKSRRTQFFLDHARSIVTENDSPDVGFRFSINAYRGCEHGCAYCYARPTHEYLGFSAGLDFESKILVKEDAPELLRKKLMSKSWQPEVIAISGNTDCYQPIERKLKLTRSCVEILAEFRNPVGIITKNALVTRDVDLYSEMASWNGAIVFLSITSLDDELIGVLEPRTSRPGARLKAIEELAKAGVPVGVNVAPVIPGLTDHELPQILKAAADHGAVMAGFTPLRLPLAVAPLFEEWLENNRPLRKSKVLETIRDLRGGKLNDPNFNSRMRGQGAFAANLKQMFGIYSRKYGLNKKSYELSTEHFRKPGDQLDLFR